MRKYVYDALGRLIAVVDPARDTVTYTYDAVGNLLSISRQSSALVSIIDFTPKSGPIGTTVTIYGTGFSTTASQNTVKFNGIVATVTSATTTQIVTKVPSGATTGPITVTTSAGSATSNTVFTVTTSPGTGAPTITGFTPKIGTPGTAVTITGTNFDPTLANDKVMFNITRSIVSSVTTTTIATSVPTGTGSGRISVATPLGKAVSSSDFFVPPPPFTAVDAQITDRMTIGGSKTITISTANKIALIVFDGTKDQRVSLAMTNVTIGTSTCCGSRVSIYNPDGTVLVFRDVGTTGGTLDTPASPATGTYTILIDPQGLNTGSMTLTLSQISPSVSVTGP